MGRARANNSRVRHYTHPLQVSTLFYNNTQAVKSMLNVALLMNDVFQTVQKRQYLLIATHTPIIVDVYYVIQ